MVNFQDSLPEGFHDRLPKKVTLLTGKSRGKKSADSTKECNNVGDIFGRLLLLSQDNPINMGEVLSYQLIPIPLSLFNIHGTMRVCKTKANLKNDLQVLVNKRLVLKPDCAIVDGCAILWIIQWASNGIVKSNFNL